MPKLTPSSPRACCAGCWPYGAEVSNSMIEAWWRSLKHQWLFFHSLDSITTVGRLVAFYVDEHNRVLPHSAFRGQTPDEMYFGTGARCRQT